MQSGLARFGYAGLISALLIPFVVVVGVRLGVRSYCARESQKVAAQTRMLSRSAEMEIALQQARGSVRSIQGMLFHEFAGSEEFGRWLRETARQQHVVLQNLAFNKDPSASPLTPALTASFRIDQPLPQVLLLLQNLQTAPRMVLIDSIRLRLGAQNDPPTYSADVVLHAYSLTGLKQSAQP
jgi:hypothetical protein